MEKFGLITNKKRVLVTGCTRGIGYSICEKYKEMNYYVVGIARQENYNSSLDEYYNCDLSDMHAVLNLCLKLKNLDIDIIINNAGINPINDFCNIPVEEFMKVQQVNFLSPFCILQACIPHMLEKKWGRIVNIGSVWSKKSKKGRASYSSSKFALDGMTLSIANEFADKDILCNIVSPGFIDTNMTWKNLGIQGVEEILQTVPIRRLAKIQEISELVYYLGSDKNTYITGQNISIDGGFTRA